MAAIDSGPSDIVFNPDWISLNEESGKLRIHTDKFKASAKATTFTITLFNPDKQERIPYNPFSYVDLTSQVFNIRDQIPIETIDMHRRGKTTRVFARNFPPRPLTCLSILRERAENGTEDKSRTHRLESSEDQEGRRARRRVSEEKKP